MVIFLLEMEAMTPTSNLSQDTQPSPVRKRSVGYRATLVTVCAVLGFLGGDDLWVALQNRTPHVHQNSLDVPAGQHWLRFEGARMDLVEAINTTGTVEVQGLLAPLRLPSGGAVKVLVETRDAARIELFKRYHFGPDTEVDRAAFREQHHAELLSVVSVQGLRMRGLVARSNHGKLRDMAKEGGLDLAPDALILVEGETPSPWRGSFFLLVALAGLTKVVLMGRRKTA